MTRPLPQAGLKIEPHPTPLFRLGQFHDELIKNSSMPLSTVERILLDDSSSLDQALR